MIYKSLTAFSVAALLLAAVQPVMAAERGDARRTRAHVVQDRALDVRTRDAYDAWRPAVPAAAFDEAARYRGTVPQIAGH
ncbi:MAG: hypothetical protein AB1586_28275 [Pseudomonadota bacterium]